MVLAHDTSSECALPMFEVKISAGYQVIGHNDEKDKKAPPLIGQ